MTGKRRFWQGFTLIELMISLAISSVVTGTGLVLYLQMSKARNLLQAELALQDSSLFINHVLRQYISQAGYRPLKSTFSKSSLFPVNDPKQSFLPVKEQWLSGEFIKTVSNGLVFRFEGVSDLTGAADGSLVDCAGRSIPENEIAEVQFLFLDGGMQCTSGDVTSTMIGSNDAINVEKFSIDWGIDTNSDLSVDEYRTSSRLGDLNEQLVDVRVSLLLSSRGEVQNTPNSYWFKGTEYVATDRRLRRESVTTIKIRQ